MTRFSLLSAAGPAALSIWRVAGRPQDLLNLLRLKSLPSSHRVRLVSLGGNRAFDNGLFWLRACEGDWAHGELHLHGGIGVASAFRSWAYQLGWAEDVPRSSGAVSPRPMLADSRSPLAARFLSQLTEEAWGAECQALSTLSRSQRNAQIPDWQARLAWADILENPPRIALFGPANAGKSTLFNHWVASHRSTVSPFPGTTRDTVEARLLLGSHIDSWECVLQDTAGVDSSLRGVDAMAQLLAQGAASQAWRRIWVFDASTIPEPALLDAALSRASGEIILVHRADKKLAWSPDQCFASRPYLSGSVTQDSELLLSQLEAAIFDSLPQQPRHDSLLPIGGARRAELLKVFPELLNSRA